MVKRNTRKKNSENKSSTNEQSESPFNSQIKSPMLPNLNIKKRNMNYSEGFIRRMSEPLHFVFIPTTPEERAASKLKFEQEQAEERRLSRIEYLKSIGREDLIGKPSIAEQLAEETKQLQIEFNFEQ